MDAIPGFRERLDAITRRLTLAKPGDGQAILVDMVQHLFQTQFGFACTAEPDLIRAVMNASLAKWAARPATDRADPRNYEKAVHETLYVLIILMRNPPRRVEYETRVRLIG